MTDNSLLESNYKSGIEPEKFQKMVAECAYYKAEKRGFATGHELEDWLEAEQKISKQCFYWFQEEW